MPRTHAYTLPVNRAQGTATQASADASISFVCEPGRLEAQAVLLAASLRAAHNEVRLVAAVPRPLPSRTSQALEALGVGLVQITNPVASDYPIANKIAALSAGDATGLRVFLDSDMLCLRPLQWSTLQACQLAAKPADLATFGSDALWRCLYDRLGLAQPSGRVVSTVSQQMMHPYFNAGMVATTEAEALAPLWAQICRDIDAMTDVNPRRPWLDQIGLPLAAARLGIHARSLGEEWNYPAHLKPLCGDPCLVHYHQPAIIAREPELLGHVSRLLLRYPKVATVVQADPAWSSVLSAIERQNNLIRPIVKYASRRWYLPTLRNASAASQPSAPTTHDLIITGIPRSGTSYVCKNLDSYDNAAVVNEPVSVFEGLRYMAEPWAVPMLHADLRARIDAGECVPNKIDARGKLVEDTAVQDAVGGYAPRLSNAQWLLATKNTLAYMARLEGIFRLMPHARVVACVRHPLDTLASWKGTFSHLAEGDPSSLPVGGLADPFLPAHLREGLREVMQLAGPAMRRAAWWRLLAAEILRWGDRIEIVRYEDMIGDPVAGMRRVLGPLANAAGSPIEPLAVSSIRTARRECLDEDDWHAVALLCDGVAGALGYDCTRLGTADIAAVEGRDMRHAHD